MAAMSAMSALSVLTALQPCHLWQLWHLWRVCQWRHEGMAPASGFENLTKSLMCIRLLIAALVFAGPALADDAPWSTFRGNVRRTGNTDNVAPPAKPEVLW